MTTRRAISPVIATVILIAVAVALGIAVAVWAGALTGNLQNSEKLIATGYIQNGDTPLILSITNQSPKSATIASITMNNVVLAGYTLVCAPAATGMSMPSGAACTVTYTIPAGAVSPGISYPITIATASGGSYPITVTAP